ncbi:MAG TPA: SDR family oxidoreductase, partial [Patescibacteria group bacterium]|nr:SDR family oxidoreductase [Patescibacteria group bacterium]
MNFGLKGKTALVLAASKGLGKASAFALAMEGADIVICARDEKALKQTAQEISKKTKTKILAIPCDVTKLSDLEHLVKKTIKEFGKIDILVNNAGGPPPSTFETTTDEQWQNAFELLLLNAIRTIRLVLPHMKQTGSGRIINMTSVSVKQPSNNLILSNAIRAGVTGMAKTLSNEIAADNITVNNICTGYFLTDRIKSLHNIDKKIKQG